MKHNNHVIRYYWINTAWRMNPMTISYEFWRQWHDWELNDNWYSN